MFFKDSKREDFATTTLNLESEQACNKEPLYPTKQKKIMANALSQTEQRDTKIKETKKKTQNKALGKANLTAREEAKKNRK
ncbi:34517_t:CDS:2 [Gigaspora margarita]|uniref:34517_t:CDS:1 n=1 Tax=Gigaspora margarita TaxID=4874 RepID=A0ABM8W213_GIGMA|nr:34517_t:CDS:2 [Gigaspora margarita]